MCLYADTPLPSFFPGLRAQIQFSNAVYSHQAPLLSSSESGWCFRCPKAWLQSPVNIPSIILERCGSSLCELIVCAATLVLCHNRSDRQTKTEISVPLQARRSIDTTHTPSHTPYQECSWLHTVLTYACIHT